MTLLATVRVLAPVSGLPDVPTAVAPARVRTLPLQGRPVQAPLPTRLGELRDVVEADKSNGAVLVYDSETGKYEVRPAELSPTGPIDGGEF